VKSSNERRGYFRINDIVGLSYSVLEDGGSVHKPADAGTVMPLTGILAEIDNNFSQAVNILWQENPTVAQALGALNKKISIVAAHTLQPDDHVMDSYEEIMVNISGSGIGFHCTESLAPKTRIRMSLLLQPSNTELKLNGSVIACENQSSDEKRPYYWMRVCFDDTNPAAIEQLIQHVVQKQYAQLGKTKYVAGA